MKLDGTVLGFDVGAKRIGVAVGSAFGSGARALAVIDVHGNSPDWTAIDKLRAEWKPDGLVVGDPMTWTVATSRSAHVRMPSRNSCKSVTACRWSWSTNVPVRSRLHSVLRWIVPRDASAVAMRWRWMR